MFRQWIVVFAILILFFSSISKADLNSDYQKYQIYTDQAGNLILRIPPTFILIASDINIPLNITPKNGVFKLIQNGDSWSLIPITQGEFDSLSLTAASNMSLEFQDIDGDGVTDLIIRDISGNRDSFIVSNLTGTANVDAYSLARNGIDLSQGSALSFKDINGDGIKDIVKDENTSSATTYLGSRSGRLIDTSATDAFTNPGNVIGLTAGQFKVTESGAATYSIPLNLPTATAGVMPQIGLSYNSQGGEGILGMGWNISGLSAISRCPKSIAIDGKIEGVKYNTSDALCFNGQRLVLNPNSTNEYHTEIDNFSVIKAFNGTNGPEYFTVTTQSNETHYYGKAPSNISTSEDAYVERGGFAAKSAAKLWALKAIVDNKGNYIRYDYIKNMTKGSHILNRIAYGGNEALATAPYNSVEFAYTDVARSLEGYSDGGILTNNKRLKQIIVKQDSDVFRSYNFTWLLTSIPEERNYVTGIQECFNESNTDCLPATKFEFEQPARKTTNSTYKICTIDAQLERDVCTSVNYCDATSNGPNGWCEVDYNTPDIAPFESASYGAAASNADRYYAQVLDFNGDGYADMLFPKDGKWHYYTTDWQVTTTESTVSIPERYKQNYLSSEPIARSIKTSTISNSTQVISGASIGEKGYARVIDYNGDGKQELLIPFASGNWHILSSDASSSEVTRCEPEPDAHICDTYTVSNKFTYKSLGILAKDYQNAVVADVDGDGLQDIVFNSGSSLNYYHNLGGTFSAAKSISLVMPASFSGSTAYEAYGNDIVRTSANIKNSAMIDVNGDGLTDIVMKMRKITTNPAPPGCNDPRMLAVEDDEAATRCRPTTTTEYRTYAFIASVNAGQVSYTATENSYLGATLKAMRVADFNGDGLTDIAYIDSNQWYYRLSKGNGIFTNSKALNGIDAKTESIYNRHQFVDLDADGRSDILAATASKNYTIFLSGPSETTESANFIKRGSLPVGTSNTPEETAMRLADVDGDAKLDLLTASSNTGTWKVQKATRPYIKEHVLTKITNAFGVQTKIAYAPLNSGLPLINLESSQKPNDEDYITPIAGMYVVTEAATQSSNTDSVLVQYAYGGPLAHKKGRGFLGFETVKTTDPQSGVVTTTQYHQLHPFTGMPKTTTRKYKDNLLSSATNTYAQGVSANAGVHVYLKSSTEASYSLDLSTDGITATDHKKVAETTTTNTHDSWNNLTQSIVDIKDAAGSLVHKTQTDNSYSSSAYAVISTDAIALERSHSQEDAQAGTQPDAKQFGRLYTTQVKKTRYKDTASGTAESQTRNTKFSYYPNGMLRESYVDGLSTAFFYDKYGNKVAEQSYAKHNATAYQKRGQYWFYDNRGQYLARQMNQNGESETYLLNGKSASTATLGRIYSKTTTGLNKLASTSYFDIQGQVVRQLLADGNYTETSKALCSSCVENYITETNTSSNQPQTVNYFDKFGRQRQQRVKGFDGAWIVTASSYDKLGRVTHSSVPSYDTVSAVKSQQYYDALGRVYKQSKLTETGTVTVYSKINGLETTSIDEKGLLYKDIHSADGQLITRIDPEEQTISYYYDAFGNARKVTTKAKDKNNAWKTQSITTSFDSYGRKTATADPDKGSWSYGYNGFGELISQTDAKSQTTTTEYDAMGRMLWRRDNSDLSCWSYGSDATKSNVGKPTGVKQWAAQSSCTNTSAMQSSETYHYDAFGRPSQVDYTIDGASYSTRSEYNAKGQLSRQHYPSNNGVFYVNFYYNANHYLYLQKDSANRELRKITAMDALGNITAQSFANGTSEARSFNQRTGRIDSIDLKKGNNYIHQLSYGLFDAKGNVEYRSHSYYNGSGIQTLGFSENFTYDSLNRIESRDLSIGTGTLTGYGYDEQYSYDGFGNIISRKGYAGGSYSVNLASYDYLQSTSANRLDSANVDGKSYSKFIYDTNGNITSDGSRSFSYNAFDKASRIKAGEQYTDYRYDSNRSVLSRSDYRVDAGEWKTFNTDYVGQLYQQERRYKGSATISSNLENTRHKYMLGNIMVVRNQNTTLGNSEQLQYQHSDHQGSTLSITDGAGAVLEQYFYSAFGKPMKLAGSSLVQAITPMERGYTGHEMLPNLDVIQMGGRIYDPNLARFLQADPFIQAPSNLQNYNRYSYVLNNPLTYTDPSGYFFKALGKFVKKYWRVIAAAVVTYFTAGAASGWAASWGFAAGTAANGAIAGAIAGAAGGFVATGSLKGALRGAFSGAAFGAIGASFNGEAGSGFFAEGGIGHIGSHALTGGIMSELQGGKFGHGFWSAGLTKGINVNGMISSFGAAYDAARIAVAAIIGGTVSEITGGKFGNGAVSSAMGQMLNGNSQIKGGQNNPIGYKASGSIPMKMSDGKYYWVDKETFGKNFGSDYLSKQTGTPMADYDKTTKQEMINVATGVSTVSGFGGLALGSFRLGQVAIGSSVAAFSLNPSVEGAGWLAVDVATMRMGPLLDGTLLQGLDHAVGGFSWLQQTGNAIQSCQTPMRC